MAFLTKIKKGIKNPLLRKILIVLVLLTLSFLIFRRLKLKEGMDSNVLASNIRNALGNEGKVIEINDFIKGQTTSRINKFWNSLLKWKNKFTKKTENSGVFVIPPVISQSLSSSAAFVNPLDIITLGRSLIESNGGVILNVDNSCSPSKVIKYKGLRLKGKRPNICNDNLFIVFGAPDNLVGTLNTPAEPLPDSNPLIDKIRGILAKVSDMAQAPEINVFRLYQKEQKKVQTKKNYNKLVKWQELFTDNTEPFTSDVFVIPPIKIDRKLQNPLDLTPLKRSVIESNGGTILNVDGNTCPEKINRIIYKGYESQGVRDANMCDNKLFIVFRYNRNINNINKNKKPQNITQGLPQFIFNKNDPISPADSNMLSGGEPLYF